MRITQHFKRQLDNTTSNFLRDMNNSSIVVEKITTTPCTHCIPGPTGESNEYCSYCNNTGIVETINYIQLKGISEWGESSSLYNTAAQSVYTGGIIYKGNCRIVIEINDFKLISLKDTIIVDDIRTKILSYNLKGMSGTQFVILDLNREIE